MAGSSCVLISRHLGFDARRASFEDDLTGRLVASGFRVLVTPHLYHLPHGSEIWSEIAQTDGPLVAAGWFHPRPLECLIREYANLEAASVLDLHEFEGAEAAFAAVLSTLGPAESSGEIRELTAGSADRWYPIIDRTRCTSCRHCLQFCLFGVYEMQSHKVVAVHPDACKDGCPACARVCPEGAIIFPLCDEPEIAGAPGTIMQPDAAARRMYYVRTGRECPVCGEVSEAAEHLRASEGAPVCQECGRPCAEAPVIEPSAMHAEIDSLIEALDDLAADGVNE